MSEPAIATPLIRPGDAEYDQARLPWNLAVDQRPAAIARPRTAGEVAEVVRWAAANGLRVAPQGTGHGAGPLGPLADAVLLRTDAMTGVVIDPRRRRAVVGAGVLWGAVIEPAAGSGLAALHGSSPGVGVVGYSLHGGIGWYARAYGLQCNSVSAIELVTADGTERRAEPHQEADLFWALRGGGGSFGVVTKLEFSLYPVVDPYAGLLAWDWRNSEAVLRRYVEWAREAPESVTTALRIMQVPPLPQLPEPVRGRQLIVIDGAVLADNDEEAERSIAPLRELDPELDSFTRMPAGSLGRLHMDPEDPTPGVSAACIVDDFPPSAVDALLSVAGPDSGTSLPVAAELRQLGGALGQADPAAGALATLDGAFTIASIGPAFSPELAAQSRKDAAAVGQAMAPFGSGRSYFNIDESPVDPAAAFPPKVLERLRSVRAEVDPSGRFVANHPIGR